MALVRAAMFGDIPEVIRLLDETPNIINERVGGWRATALIWACRKGWREVAEILLDRGADVDMRSENGWTALFHATVEVKYTKSSYCCLSAQPDAVSLLLSRGADASLQDHRGSSALKVAALRGSTTIVRLFVQHARQYGLQKEVIDAVDHSNKTALWCACSRGNTEAARILLLEGAADHTIANLDYNLTPKQAAQQYGPHRSCVALIEWWENEMIKRPYVLLKARRVHDDRTLWEKYPDLPLPPYIAQRSPIGEHPPRVQMVPLPLYVPQFRDEAERGEIIGFVMTELNEELFKELLEGLSGRMVIM